jgi:hypothetical protein
LRFTIFEALAAIELNLVSLRTEPRICVPGLHANGGMVMFPDWRRSRRAPSPADGGKLLRAYSTQVETLRRLRGGDEQKTVVKHVMMNQGGQAIVARSFASRRG